MGQVYLLHFEPKYKGAGHYLGYTNFLQRRIAHHRNGTGANLTKVASQAGCQLKLVRVWDKATKETERKLKKSRHHSRLCPLCNPYHFATRGKIK